MHTSQGEQEQVIISVGWLREESLRVLLTNLPLAPLDTHKMKFRYSVALPHEVATLSSGRATLFFGSCFAQELYQWLYHALYPVAFSPFGISYNPLTIAASLERLLGERETISEEELFYHQGEWHSFSHHSSFSHAEKKQALQHMRVTFGETKQILPTAQAICMTWGTAYVYELKEPPHRVVNNCHKLPQSTFFRRRLLSPDEILSHWTPLLQKLREQYPHLRLICTISPIPHYRDGARENSISKGTLHLALHHLEEQNRWIEYFPAYELMREELRDYRFYRPDFAHPTEEAVRYILEQFGTCYLDPCEAPWQQAWQKVHAHYLHLPLSTNPELLEQHYRTVLRELEDFAEQYPQGPSQAPHPYLAECLSTTSRLLKNIEKGAQTHI